MGTSRSFAWGMFSPEHIPSTRRTRTLGLASVVRHYNDRAVPGIGGLHFAMPLIWGLLGIALSEDADLRAKLGQLRPLPTTNAVEALVMWLGHRQQGEMSRGAGHRKLANREDASFAALNRPGAYITQPLRMRTVQPLPELGLVEAPGQRFNYYRVGGAGQEILDQYKREFQALREWVLTAPEPQSLSRRLSELLPDRKAKPGARQLVERQLLQYGGESANRRRALKQLGHAGAMKLGETKRCPESLDREHFEDIRSGIAFINLRDGALNALDAVERFLRAQKDRRAAPAACAGAAQGELQLLRESAQHMRDHADSSEGCEAHNFAKLCLQTPSEVIHDLAKRDGTVIIREAADCLFLGSVEPPEQTNDSAEGIDPLPEGLPQLPRISNFFNLLEDIDGGN